MKPQAELSVPKPPDVLGAGSYGEKITGFRVWD